MPLVFLKSIDMFLRCSWIFILKIAGHPVVASKYSLWDMENNTQSKLCSMFKYSPNGKGMVYGPNGI